jgi:hypothetical protein
MIKITITLLLLLTHLPALSSDEPNEKTPVLVDKKIEFIPDEHFDIVLFRSITSFSSSFTLPLNDKLQVEAGLAKNKSYIYDPERSLIFSAAISYSF